MVPPPPPLHPRISPPPNTARLTPRPLPHQLYRSRQLSKHQILPYTNPSSTKPIARPRPLQSRRSPQPTAHHPLPQRNPRSPSAHFPTAAAAAGAPNTATPSNPKTQTVTSAATTTSASNARRTRPFPHHLPRAARTGRAGSPGMIVWASILAIRGANAALWLGRIARV